MSHIPLDPSQIRLGDVGYYADVTTPRPVVAIAYGQIELHANGRPNDRITAAEAADQNWLWYREILPVGTKWRNGQDGPHYGRNGVVVPTPLRGESMSPRIWIRWEGNILANGYRPESAVATNLIRLPDDARVGDGTI